MAEFENEVVIFGGDHHNTLAVIRCLGKHKCRLSVLVHGKRIVENVRVFHSRYAKNNFQVLEEEEKAVQFLLDYATGEKKILFPCSDFAAYVIDHNAQALSQGYILPGYRTAPGKVVEMMDKLRQEELAREKGFPMARTWLLSSDEKGFIVPEDLVFPCIIKPQLSAFGKKSDIRIIEEKKNLPSVLQEFKEKGYTQLLIQQFLIKEYEVCAYGCIVSDDKKFFGGAVKKVREYPPKGGGSLTFAQFISEPLVNELMERVIDYLWEEGYRGMYDIEMLVCRDGVYLNEINFRHSGNGYALPKNKIPAPYLSCLDLMGLPFPPCPRRVEKNTYHMDEINDVIYAGPSGTGLGTVLKSMLKTKAFSVFDISDLPGVWGFYSPYPKKAWKKFVRKIKKGA